MFKVPDVWRIRDGKMASDERNGNNGAFRVPVLSTGIVLNVIASDGEEWEHVSVSLPYRAPVWDEMCAVKDIFWSPEDQVIQYHPPKSEYINMHPYCLHMWRPTVLYVPRPPKWMVGY